MSTTRRFLWALLANLNSSNVDVRIFDVHYPKLLNFEHLVKGLAEDLSFRGLAEMILSGPRSTLRFFEAIVYRAFDVDPFRGLLLELAELSQDSDCLETLSIELRGYDNILDEMEIQLKFLDSLFPAAFPRLQKLSIFGQFRVNLRLLLQGAPGTEDIYQYYDDQFLEVVERSCPNILSKTKFIKMFEMWPLWN